MVKICPLLERYEVRDKDTLAEHPEANWAKEICFNYCPLDECIEERMITKRIVKLLQLVEIPLRIAGEFRCRRCGGVVSVEDNKFKCLQCNKEYTKPHNWEE